MKYSKPLLWLNIILTLYIACLLAGCGGTSLDSQGKNPPGTGVTLAQDYVSQDITHKAGEFILLSRILGGYVDAGPSCTNAAGVQVNHFHSNKLPEGIYVDGKGPFLESQAQHDACGYGLVTTQ